MTRRQLLVLTAFAALPFTTRCREATAPDPSAVATLELRTSGATMLALTHGITVTAVARNSNHDSIAVSRVAWTNSQPGVATMTQAPFPDAVAVTALAVGSTEIRATIGSVSASVFVNVHPPGPVAATQVNPTQVSVVEGGSYPIAVIARDTDGVTVTPRTVTYTSSTPAVATVSGSGVVTGVSVGRATVMATSDGIAASALVIVNPAPIPARGFIWTALDGMKELGTLPGYTASYATAINASGVVVGWVSNEIAKRPPHAFIWTASGGMRDLGVLAPGESSEAHAINASGQVVGAATYGGAMHAVLWEADGTMRAIGDAGASVANGINDAGQVVGSIAGYDVLPFVWSKATGMMPIAAAVGGSASAINRSGVVVGSTNGQAFQWSAAGGLKQLARVGTDPNASVLAVNDAGDMAGWTGDLNCDPYYGCSGAPSHAVRWSSGLPPVSVGASVGAQAMGLNNVGQVVGIDRNHAFVWSAATGSRDLGVLPGRVQSIATAVNDAGQVVGTSQP